VGPRWFKLPVEDQPQFAIDVVFEALIVRLVHENPNSLEALRSQVLEDHLNEQAVEGLIQKYCEERAAGIKAMLRSVTNPFDIVNCLKGVMPSWQFEEALNEVLKDLQYVCGALDSAVLKEQDPESELRSEERELVEVAKAVRSVATGDTRPVDDSAGCSVPQHTKFSATGCRVARAQAAATMYSDAFNRNDEERLLFIAAHVAQVLDNHLLHQARQRGLPVDYRTLGVLGLEYFGVQLLDAMQSLVGRIDRALHYLAERENMADSNEYVERSSIPQGQDNLSVPLVDKLMRVAESARQSSQQDVLLQLQLTVVTGLSHQIGTRILEQVLFHASPDVSPEFKCDESGAIFEVIFHAWKLTCPCTHPLAEAMLSCIKGNRSTSDESATLNLLVRLSRDGLAHRDPCWLWSAFRLLEDVLKIVDKASAERSKRGHHEPSGLSY